MQIINKTTIKKKKKKKKKSLIKASLTFKCMTEHMAPSLNFAWLSRGVPLLGSSETGLLCPITPRGAIKRFFPEYRHPYGKGGNNTHNSH